MCAEIRLKLNDIHMFYYLLQDIFIPKRTAQIVNYVAPAFKFSDLMVTVNFRKMEGGYYGDAFVWKRANCQLGSLILLVQYEMLKAG